MGKTFVYENKKLRREAHVSGIQGEYMVEFFQDNNFAKQPAGYFDSLTAAEIAAKNFVQGEG